MILHTVGDVIEFLYADIVFENVVFEFRFHK